MTRMASGFATLQQSRPRSRLRFFHLSVYKNEKWPSATIAPTFVVTNAQFVKTVVEHSVMTTKKSRRRD